MARIPGAGKFAKFLKANKISIRRASLALHVSDPTIIAWRDGDKTPTPEHRVAIRTWTNGAVVEDDWRTDREREQSASAAVVKPFEPEPSSSPEPAPQAADAPPLTGTHGQGGE